MAVGDSLRKVVSGERLPGFPAAAFNAFVDTVHAVRAQQFNAGGGQSERFRQGDIISVRNDSGQDANKFDVLGIAEPIIDPDDNLSQFKERVALVAGMPTELGKFGICIEPIADGKMGRVQVSGICLARIVVDPDHYVPYRVDVSGNTRYLVSNAMGSAFILWHGAAIPDDEDDAKWIIVRLGNPPPNVIAGKLDGTLNPGSSATLSIWIPDENSPGVRIDSTENVTVYDWLLESGQTVASGKKVFAAYVDGRYEVIAAACPTP